MIYAGADLHIEKSLRKNRTELQRDGFEALFKFRDAILADPCDEEKHVLLAGDIFNQSSVNGTALKAFADFVDVLWEKHISTYTITGNHDGDYGPSILETQGCSNINEKTVDMDGRKVYGLDYATTEDLKCKLKNVSCDILVLHTPFAHLLNFEGSYQLKLEDLPNVPVTIAGDVHVKDFREYSSGRFFISPGALHPCAVDQGDVHGFFKLSAKDKIGNWKFCQITTRKILRTQLRTDKDIIEFKERLNNFQHNTLKPVVDLRYSTDLTDKIIQLENAFSDKFIFIKKPNISGKILEGRRGDLDTKVDLKKFTMIDVLHYHTDPVKNPEDYSFLEELLSTQNPDTFLQSKIDSIE